MQAQNQLMLHCGAEEIDYDGLRELVTPEATRSHVPVPHFRVVDAIRHTLKFYGHDIVDQAYGYTKDGNRFFGVLTLSSEYGDYVDVIGVRNSHDKTFPVSIATGASVFVCDNLAFTGEQVLRRRHTAKVNRDLPWMISELIEPLATMREQQHRLIEGYKASPMSDQAADHAILNVYRAGLLNLQRIPPVLEQWNNPECDWGDKTAWRLHNALTFNLKDRVLANPKVTIGVNEIIDQAMTPAIDVQPAEGQVWQ